MALEDVNVYLFPKLMHIFVPSRILVREKLFGILENVFFKHFINSYCFLKSHNVLPDKCILIRVLDLVCHLEIMGSNCNFLEGGLFFYAEEPMSILITFSCKRWNIWTFLLSPHQRQSVALPARVQPEKDVEGKSDVRLRFAVEPSASSLKRH